MTGLEKLFAWWEKQGWSLEPKKLCCPGSEIMVKVHELLAEEKSSSTTPDEFEKWLDELIESSLGVSPINPNVIILKYRQVRADNESELVRELREDLKLFMYFPGQKNKWIAVESIEQILSKHGGK